MTDTEHGPAVRAERLLRISEVSETLSLAPSTIYKYLKLGHFPRPIKSQTGGAVRWTQSSINAWVDERAAEANA